VHKRKIRAYVENRTLLISRQLSRLLFRHVVYAEKSRGFFSCTLLMSRPPLCRLHRAVNTNTLSRLVEFFNLHHGIGSNSAYFDTLHFLRPCYLALISSFQIRDTFKVSSYHSVQILSSLAFTYLIFLLRCLCHLSNN